MSNHQEILRTKAFIRELEKISGWTISRMAKDAGFAHTTLSRFMKTENPKHNVKFSTLSAIANNLLNKVESQVSLKSHQIVERLLEENDGILPIGLAPEDIEKVWYLAQAIEKFGIPTKGNESVPSYSPKELRIVELAAADEWRPEYIHSLSTETIKTVPYPYKLYPDTVVGIEILDNSMNKRFPKGSILICTPDSKGAIQEIGKYYIFARYNEETERTEISCKRLEKDDEGNLWLYPESTDPRHIPISLDNDLKNKNGTTQVHFSTDIIAHIIGAIVKF
ncbi:hypothetical protein GCM10011332_26290 [Terasakiella brassicae]|uniref:Peptidase S24/S26A/S26B/S26C domain-containing protein n=1 Tax=Terasakiella brassicae TaxID=1634917 RepID=A0A917C5I3_9PROT|nr:LexA family transcriptional regulator [Terasakiella brassicae]GGF71049.1 hypothetical protein GCM10011332_26290 [Terasakiella brassicae]